MYIYRNSLVLHLHSISIMRCWMGRMQLYLFYFYVSSIIFQPHSILCFYILSIHIMCDLRRVERCHLENSLQMPKHFTSVEVRDFWENIFPLSRRFEATLYALWLASDNCDSCINTFSEFSESSGCGKSRWRVSHTIKYFRMRFWCILNAWWRCAERKCIWSQKPQCIFRTDFPRIQYVSLQPPQNSINASRFPFTKCDTVVWALCLTACCYVWLPNKHFMSQASWSHGKLVNCLKICITRGESFPFFSPPFYVCSSSRFSNPYPPLGSPFSQPFWPGHN